jgi:hypothetical protein
VVPDFDGIASGIDEYKYDNEPLTGPCNAPVYDVAKCGVASDDTVTCNPFGVGKSSRSRK